MQKGIGELHDGSEKLTGGLNKLVSKSGELQTGTTDHIKWYGTTGWGQNQLEVASQKLKRVCKI